MKTPSWTLVILLLALATGASPAGAGDLRNSLQSGDIESMRLNLAPAGAGLGLELEVGGDDPRLEPLLTLIREAEPGGGHKCPNEGAIRFFMRDGAVVGIGLLPGHQPGEYGLRVYDGERPLVTYRVDRDDLLGALEGLGVSAEDPAFRE